MEEDLIRLSVSHLIKGIGWAPFKKIHFYLVLSAAVLSTPGKNFRPSRRKIRPHTDKKENKILYIRKFRWDRLQSHIWGRAPLHMRKCQNIYPYIRVYEEAVSHIWLCNRSLLNFLIDEENFIFFFISPWFIQISVHGTGECFRIFWWYVPKTAYYLPLWILL